MTASSKKKRIFIPISLGISLFLNSLGSPISANDYFQSEIKEVKEKMLKPSYWQSHQEQDEIFYSSNQILKQNSRLLKENPHMNDLENYPHHLSESAIRSKIVSISKRPSSTRYHSNGSIVSEKTWDQYSQSLNLAALSNSNDKTKTVHFGLVVKRSDLRTFPTIDSIFKKPNEINLDRFQETALFPAEVVAILHASVDARWLFVSNYNYSGWIDKLNIAVASKEEVFEFAHHRNFLTITGDKVFTSFNPYSENVSQVQLDMGTTLPLVEKNKIPTSLGGQNTYTSYVINLPTRNSAGKLEIQMALIPRNKDVHVGYLPFTEENIINQSFKFLGERYGWGHSFNARDCTGFVGDVFKTFGILMPRNSGQQAKSKQGQNIRFSKSASNEEKLKEILKLNPGDLIYIPGHVMMFLGLKDNQPFIIHDVSGLSYYDSNNKYIKSQLNGVSVTPLLPLQLNAEKSYLDDVYTLKKMRK